MTLDQRCRLAFSKAFATTSADRRPLTVDELRPVLARYPDSAAIRDRRIHVDEAR